MGRPCSICQHPEAEAINQALASGESYSSIAQRFAVSRHAAGRHARGHLPLAIMAAQAAEEELSADNLLSYVRDLRDWARRIAERAEKRGDLRAALLGVRECARIVELVLKWRGMLRDDQAAGVQIFLPAVDVADLSDRELDAMIRRGGYSSPTSSTLPEAEDGADGDLVADLQERVQRAEHGQRVAEAAMVQERDRLAKKLKEAEEARAWAEQRADRLQAEARRTSVMYVNP